VHGETIQPPPETLERILKLAEERCPGAECLTQKIPLEVELRT